MSTAEQRFVNIKFPMYIPNAARGITYLPHNSIHPVGMEVIHQLIPAGTQNNKRNVKDKTVVTR